MAGLLGRNAWLIPLIFAVALGVAGLSGIWALEDHQREQLESQMGTTLATATNALEIWRGDNEAAVRVAMADLRIRDAVLELLSISRSAADPRAALLQSPLQSELRAILDPMMAAHRFTGWGAEGPSGLVLAGSTEAAIGFRPPSVVRGEGDEIIHTPPIPYATPAGTIHVIITGSPVFDREGNARAYFGFSIDPAAEFARTLEVARVGESGETYAINDVGVMISSSRFDDQLRKIGILPADRPEQGSPSYVEVRDPGGDLTIGFQTDTPIKARAFTKAAGAAIGRESGSDVAGYRDYRGVPVIGAWAWIEDLGIGLVSELDVAEAYAGLDAIALRFRILLGLLVAAALLMGVYSLVLSRLQGRVDEARQLGRYQVVRKLGRGGMGTVYLARHALLQRPTAIKVLEAEAGSAEAVTRFEREVQTSSGLSHPNTIEVFDFGHTPDGAFYYAMEYVGGPTLQALVDTDGPQPEARVLSILCQAASSLAEAHRAEIIHRDLKPSNIMLCERGGLYDFVKVLDFGLVRQQEQAPDLALTATQALTGSPLYMSPEALESPRDLGPPGDVYQLGAVGYFLLAGRPPFEGNSVVAVLAQHMKERPATPSEVLGHKVDPLLESVIMRCLAKSPAERYANAAELLAALEECEIAVPWTQRDAGDWWNGWSETHAEEVSSASGSSSTPSGWSIDLGARLKRERARATDTPQKSPHPQTERR